MLPCSLALGHMRSAFGCGGLRLLPRLSACSPFSSSLASTDPSASLVHPRLDFKQMLLSLDKMQENIDRRNVRADAALVARLYKEESALKQHVMQARHRRNQVAAETKVAAQAGHSKEREALVEEGKRVKMEIGEVEFELDRVSKQLMLESAKIPNDTCSESKQLQDMQRIRHIQSAGELFYKQPGAAVKDHLALADSMNSSSSSTSPATPPAKREPMIDMKAGSSVAGARFSVLRREAALLELALVQWAMGKLVEKDFEPLIVPDLVYGSLVAGAGFNPREVVKSEDGGEPQEHNTIYHLDKSPLALAGTSELALAGMLQGRILDSSVLPLKFAAFSHCFRTEAGHAGAATRGIYRLHQFSKVEMFMVTRPEDSPAALDLLVATEEELFGELGLEFQVLEMPPHELGAPAFRKLDIEAWMPGHQGGVFGEISSASNCTDFQSRRLNIRHRLHTGQATEFVHTLNGTAAAIPRLVVAIMEQFQTADGRVAIPTPLRPFMGNQTHIPYL